MVASEAVGGGPMTTIALVLLAIIAIATTFMAILQIGANLCATFGSSRG